jgi:hypothetical protein
MSDRAGGLTDVYPEERADINEIVSATSDEIGDSYPGVDNADRSGRTAPATNDDEPLRAEGSDVGLDHEHVRASDLVGGKDDRLEVIYVVGGRLGGADGTNELRPLRREEDTIANSDDARLGSMRMPAGAVSNQWPVAYSRPRGQGERPRAGGPIAPRSLTLLVGTPAMGASNHGLASVFVGALGIAKTYADRRGDADSE